MSLDNASSDQMLNVLKTCRAAEAPYSVTEAATQRQQTVLRTIKHESRTWATSSGMMAENPEACHATYYVLHCTRERSVTKKAALYCTNKPSTLVTC